MIYKIVLSCLLFLSTISYAFAQKTVKIYSRYSIESKSSLVPIIMIRQMNEIQKEYEFVLSELPGSNGDAAALRSIAEARAGRETLLLTAASTYSTNRYVMEPVFDRDKDLVPIFGISGANFAFMVNPNSKVETLVDLAKMIKDKPQAYYARTSATGNTVFFEALFRKEFGITNIKQLTYQRPGDMLRSILMGESDYTVFPVGFYPELKHIAISNDVRSSLMPNVLTGKESGLDDFLFTSISLISVPKEQKDFGMKIIDILTRSCMTNEVKNITDKIQVERYCYGPEKTYNQIRQEIDLMEKHKELLIELNKNQKSSD